MTDRTTSAPAPEKIALTQVRVFDGRQLGEPGTVVIDGAVIGTWCYHIYHACRPDDETASQEKPTTPSIGTLGCWPRRSRRRPRVVPRGYALHLRQLAFVGECVLWGRQSAAS